MQGWSDKELLQLPDAEGEAANEILEFKERLAELALNGSNPRPDYLAIAQLRAMQMALKRGSFAMTAKCFIGWARVAAQKENFD